MFGCDVYISKSEIGLAAKMPVRKLCLLFFFVDLLHHPSFFPLVVTHQKVFATHQKKVGEEDKGKEQEQEMEEYDKR